MTPKQILELLPLLEKNREAEVLEFKTKLNKIQIELQPTNKD